MNSIADLGGMHGFGPVLRQPDEPMFHADWERRVFGIDIILETSGFCPTDEVRHGVERMPPLDYLRASYYERWLASLEWIARERGLLTEADYQARIRDVAARLGSPLTGPQRPEIVERVLRAMHTGAPKSRQSEAPARFKVGDRVRTRNLHPKGHTRLPRYARGKAGVVDKVYGAFVLPDSIAHGFGESPEHMYGVWFDAVELWGDVAETGAPVHLDLLESYLEPTALPQEGDVR